MTLRLTTRPLLALAFSATLLATPVFAQEFLIPQAPDPAAIPSWPVTVPGDEVLVITVAEPGKRHSCKVKSLTAQALTCSRSLGRDPIVYAPDQVEALISPRSHSLWWVQSLLAAGIGGGIMYGAVLLNPISEAAAITVGIIAAFVIISSPVYSLDAEDTPDRLLFLRPGHTLAVELRK